MMEPDHTPPHSYQAEQGLLGALLCRNAAVLDAVGGFLRPEHFADPTHGRIYEACLTLINTGRRADAVTVAPMFAQDQGLIDLGGTAYLARLVAMGGAVIAAADYGRMVHDLFLRRELIAAGEDLVNAAFDTSTPRPAAEIVSDMEARLFEMTARSETGSGPRSFADIAPAMLRQAEEANRRGGVIGLHTGLADLDDLLGGMAPSNLLVLGARPSMGKSALACAIAHHVARSQAPVGLFSLEMSAEEVAQRMAADASGIPYDRIRSGRLTREEWLQVRQAEQALAALPLHVDDTASLPIARLSILARRMVRKHGLGLIVVDHLHLLRGTGKDRLAELTQISAALKVMARELKIPVLALAQLNRGTENQEDKRPQLSSLRESGSIEQDADMVAMLHREHYYLSKSQPQRKANEGDKAFNDRLADWHSRCADERHRAEVMVLKNRHGRTGTATLFCDMGLGRFRSLEARHGMETVA